MFPPTGTESTGNTTRGSTFTTNLGVFHLQPAQMRLSIPPSSAKNNQKLHTRLLKHTKVDLGSSSYNKTANNIIDQFYQLQKTVHVRSQSTAQRALRFARAVRKTLITHQTCADREISEAEEFLGFLRAKRSMIEVQVADADEQIGVLREVLDMHKGVDYMCTDNEESAAPPSSSSSLGSDDLMDLVPTSDDHQAWTTAELTAVTDSPSIQSIRQKYIDELPAIASDNNSGAESDEGGSSEEELSEELSEEESGEEEPDDQE